LQVFVCDLFTRGKFVNKDRHLVVSILNDNIRKVSISVDLP